MTLLRRHLALFSLILLVPAAVIASLSVHAVSYVQSKPFVASDVARGDVGRIGPVAFELTGSVVVESGTPDGEALGVPTGSDLVVVTLEVDPGSDVRADAFPCELWIVDPDAGDRRWRVGYSTEADYSIPDGFETSCELGGGRPYTLRQQVLVAQGATAGGYLEVTIPEYLPNALRMR